MATKLLYMDDFGVMDCEAKILNITKTDDGRWDVIADQTCFYPRGGGQDWDTGTLRTANGLVQVDEVRLDESGVVHHIGTLEGDVKTDEKVECKVDTERRTVNTRLHSAGHVIDMAVSRLGLEWIPGRGAHYPHMSFVEYTADNPDAELRDRIQGEIIKILEAEITNELRYVDKNELAQICRHVPENLPANKPIRVVLYDDFGVPCGGTHVEKIRDIGAVEVTKIKSKNGITKVSYAVKGINS